MICKLISYQIHPFNESVSYMDAYQVASECEKQDEFKYIEFEEVENGVIKCDEIDAIVNEFSGQVDLTSDQCFVLAHIIEKHLFASK